MLDWILGLGFSLFIAGAAYIKKSLSASGAIAAVAVGTLLYTFGSLAWYGTLLVFFITSTLLSKWKQRQKAKVEANYAKSGRRDAGQVVANGGVGVLLCMANHLWPHPVWWLAYIGVMATVTADTWATEIGGLSRSEPRSIMNGRRVLAGTSGGVTRLGLGASVAGGLLIGVSAWLMTEGKLLPVGVVSEYEVAGGWKALLVLLMMGGLGGTVGSLVDSWLGAVVQVMYRCSLCGKEIEKNRHCAEQAVRIRGRAFMTNDAVNMISSIAGGLWCVVLWAIFH